MGLGINPASLSNNLHHEEKIMQIFTLKNIVLVSGALFAMLVLSSGTALAQEGKALYNAKGCAACHGPDGKSPTVPLYPKLAGQTAPYMVAQLKAFKTQARKSAQSAMMWGMAAQLSDSDMQKIADYLSKVK